VCVCVCVCVCVGRGEGEERGVGHMLAQCVPEPALHRVRACASPV